LRSEDRERNGRGQLAGFAYTTQDPTTAGQPTLAEPTLDNPQHKKNIIKEEHKEEIYAHSDFEFENLFWKIYPRKTGKQAAHKAYVKAVAKVGSIVVLAGVNRFASDPNLPESQFIPYPATWLNEGRWDDEPYPERPKSPEQAQKAYRDLRDRDVQITSELLAEERERRSRAVAPPKCEHGKSVVSCLVCIKSLG